MSRKHKPPAKQYHGDDANPYAKYRAKRTEIDGHLFASKAEGRRYLELKQMLRDGLIRDLTLQPRFRLEVNGKKICDYVADFSYHDVEKGEDITEDVKGAPLTPVYRVKRNLMLAIYGIEILETYP